MGKRGTFVEKKRLRAKITSGSITESFSHRRREEGSGGGDEGRGQRGSATLTRHG